MTISATLQDAIDNLKLQDVCLRDTFSRCHDNFDPKYPGDLETLKIQQMHAIRQTTIADVENNGKLVRVFVRLGVRWANPGDAQEEPEVFANIEAVKIADLARKMMHLMGRRERTAEQPDGEIELVFSGLRPGEKLFEELLIGDDPQGTAHPRIMMAREVCMTWPEVADTVKQLQHASQAFDCEGVLLILKTAPTGFAPNGGVEDLVWNLNPRPVVAGATDKAGTDGTAEAAGKAGTDLKSVPRAGKEKRGQI